MKLVIYNGSPRNKKSNSLILINQFLSGYHAVDPAEIPVHHLAGRKRREEHLDAYSKAEAVLIFFPLYTDCMPGIVKEFFEEITLVDPAGSKKIGFVVQSGFRESVHSYHLEKYLKKFSARLGHEYLGTVIRGGVEGIQIMPDWMTGKLFGSFQALGRYFAENGQFDPDIKEKLARPYKLSALQKLGFRIFKLLGFSNFYWNSNLKKHGAYEKRFDRPYASG